MFNRNKKIIIILLGLMIFSGTIVLRSQLSAAPNFDFSLSIDPIKGTASQGSSVSINISTKVVSGTPEPVSFGTAGPQIITGYAILSGSLGNCGFNNLFNCDNRLPPGVTVSFTPESCTPPCSSILKLSTSENNPLYAGYSKLSVGVYSGMDPTLATWQNNPFPITIVAAAKGATKTATYNLTVACDSSYTTSNAAYDFGTKSGKMSGLCAEYGKYQHFKITIPSGQSCNLEWVLTPDAEQIFTPDYGLKTNPADYDLYARFKAPKKTTDYNKRASYEARGVNGAGVVEKVSQNNLSAGTYYVLVSKENAANAGYSLAANLTDCVGATTVSETTTQSTSQQTTTQQQTTTTETAQTTEQTTTQTTQTAACDADSYNNYNNALDLTSTGIKSNLCGKEQFFKVAISANTFCDLKWTLQPDQDSDYDLYVKWGSDNALLSRFNYGDRSANSKKGEKDELSKTRLEKGVYYAMAYKEAETTGNYSITATLFNCTTTTQQTSTSNPQYIAQLKDQILQITNKIKQLQEELNKMQQQPQTWCYTFAKTLKYQDRGDDVKALQAALMKEGLYSGLIGGYFGELTRSSVIAFQEKYKSEILTPLGFTQGTGIVAKSTINKLNQLYSCK